jgi:hypothetical protein
MFNVETGINRASRYRNYGVSHQDIYVTGMAAALLVVEESMAGLGSAATTARERGEKYNLLHDRFSKLGAPLTIVLVCFAQGVGTYIYGEKLSTSMSTSDMVLIDVAPSTSANRPK